MKAIRFTALACALACLAITSASATGEPDSADQQLRKKVASLIKNVDLSPMEYHEQDATIKFL
ncbi:MAG: hypothetical protein R3330_10250, partial [Saprospiraceae bacterium]|nr:hypothetical protein [Saprospiraceae bacterium]